MSQTTKPVALDETMKATNEKLNAIAQAIRDRSHPPDWNLVDNKPFEALSEDDFNVENGVLGLGNSFNQVTEKLSDVDKQIFGKNKFNPNDVISGKYFNTSGAVNNNTNWNYGIIYIPIESEKIYTISGQKQISGSSINGWFDGNKNYISTINVRNVEGATAQAPTNAEYIGLSVSLQSGYDELPTLQVEEGNTATSYEPYAKPNAVLTQELSAFVIEVEKDISTSGSTTFLNPDSNKYICIVVKVKNGDTWYPLSQNSIAGTSVSCDYNGTGNALYYVSGTTPSEWKNTKAKAIFIRK